jgi:CubicO group peptidase (beta-lactamase class C family)
VPVRPGRRPTERVTVTPYYSVYGVKENPIRNTILIICIFSLTGCLARHGNLYPLPGGEYEYTIPESMEDGLRTSSIEASLFSPEKMRKLKDFFDLLKKGTFGEIHGVLLAYKGQLVLEEYFPGYRFYGPLTRFSAADTHHLASVTKSLTSLCVGIAVDKGFIQSINQPFLDFYPNDIVPDRETKAGITLGHLLTMTAGLEWDEWSLPYTDPRNDVVRLYRSPDPLAFCLERKTVARPGGRWVYSGAYPNLLGDIVRRASGLSLDKFAQRYLYEPLGITNASWITLARGFIYASGDAELRPRDMLKIGLLVQNHGLWNGRRVVSAEWLDQSMRRAAQADPSTGYGFMWWLPELPGPTREAMGPVYMASGWGDQFIVIAPQRELVLVITGGNYAPPDPGQIPILSYMLQELFSD